MSQRSNTTLPVSAVAGIRMRWSAARNSMRERCGTASPIKPTGPQKAVTVPARSVVERKTRRRVRCTSRPIVRAYCSPKSNRLSGLMTATAKAIPTTTATANKASCVVVTSPSEPIVQITNDFSAPSLERYCRICTTASIPDEHIMPRIRITMISLMRRLQRATNERMAAAPIQAAPAMPSDERSAEPPKPRSGAPSNSRATPKLAPELIPST